MRFNSAYDMSLTSMPVEIDPAKEYEISFDILNENAADLTVTVQEYDCLYTTTRSRERTFELEPSSEWQTLSFSFTPNYYSRYIEVKIEAPYGAYNLYIDNVSAGEMQPLITKITDTIGRTVTFDYGEKAETLADSAVTVTVTSPDGENAHTMTYNRASYTSTTKYKEMNEQRHCWYLDYADTEGNGNIAYYEYFGGHDGTEYTKLYTCHNSKTQSASVGFFNKPVLSSVRRNNRKTIFEYEKTRKNLGTRGFYDSMRVNRCYQEYATTQNNTVVYEGVLNDTQYSYSGVYNGTAYTDETGYPNYSFDADTALGEQWTFTKTTNKTEKTTISNGVIIKTEDITNGITNEYTYGSDFKDLPTLVKNTITDGEESKIGYIVLDYDNTGRTISESAYVSSEIYANSALLDKYTTHYTYGDYGQITEKKYYNNENGAQITESNTYDALGRLTKSTDSCGSVTEYTYSSGNQPTKITVYDPQNMDGLLGGNAVTDIAYDGYGLYPISETEHYNGQTAVTSYTYEYLFGNVLSITNPDGGTREYIYDGSGRVQYEFSGLIQANGRMFYYIDYHTYLPHMNAAGFSTRVLQLELIARYAKFLDSTQVYQCSNTGYVYEYNGTLAVKMITDYTRPLESGTEYEVSGESYYTDNRDRLVKYTDREGNSTLYTYDTQDRLLGVTLPNGTAYAYTYDDIDLIADVSLADGSNRITTKYDDYGNIISRTVYPNGSTTYSEYFTYDIAGNVLSYTDPNANKTEYEYDNAGRLIKTILPDGTIAEARYTAFDTPSAEKLYSENGEEYSRITWSDERGGTNAKFYAWDKRLMYSDDYTHNAMGQTSSSKHGAYEYSYVYDEEGNPTGKFSGDAAIVRMYNQYGIDVSGSNDASVTITQYIYDAIGRVSTVNQGRKSMTYSYNLNDLVTDFTTPFELTSSYGYDANGRITSVSAGSKSYGYTYTPSGMVESISYPNRITVSYSYDNANRVTSIVTKKGTAVIESIAYTYDGNGNVLTQTRNGSTTTYTYDNLNRLKTANYNGDTVTYTYDASNNRTSEIYSDGTEKYYTYDSFNRLQSVETDGIITDVYEYDTAGALIKHNDIVYTYDKWGKLASVTDGENITEYTYDADGIRTSKTGTVYYTNPNGIVIAEADGNLNETAQMVYGNGILSRKIETDWYYYITNAHGDVIAVTDENGNVVNRYTYDAWGNTLSEEETIPNPIRYAGQYYDEELNMYYCRARYYDPAIGRFTSIDAEEGDISNPLDWNQYVYCRNNPVYYVDWDGKKVYIVGNQITAQAGFRLSTGKGIIVDENYNIALINEISFGGALDVGIGIGGYLATIDTDSIYDVQGGSFELGGSVSPIKIGPLSLGAGYDMTISLGGNKCKEKIYSINAGLGFMPAEGHAQLSYTAVYTPWYMLY